MNVLSTLVDKIGGGVAFLGGAVAVFGLVQIGIALKDGAGGGGQLAIGISALVGGIVVIVAAGLFGSLDTSWAS